MKAATRVCIL